VPSDVNDYLAYEIVAEGWIRWREAGEVKIVILFISYGCNKVDDLKRFRFHPGAKPIKIPASPPHPFLHAGITILSLKPLKHRVRKKFLTFHAPVTAFMKMAKNELGC